MLHGLEHRHDLREEADDCVEVAGDASDLGVVDAGVGGEDAAEQVPVLPVDGSGVAGQEIGDLGPVDEGLQVHRPTIGLAATIKGGSITTSEERLAGCPLDHGAQRCPAEGVDLWDLGLFQRQEYHEVMEWLEWRCPRSTGPLRRLRRASVGTRLRGAGCASAERSRCRVCWR